MIKFLVVFSAQVDAIHQQAAGAAAFHPDPLPPECCDLQGPRGVGHTVPASPSRPQWTHCQAVISGGLMPRFHIILL